MLNFKKYYINVMRILKMAPNPIDYQVSFFPNLVTIIFKKIKKSIILYNQNICGLIFRTLVHII
jgi:hypothetical protein